MVTHDFTLRILADGDQYIITAECSELAGQAGPVIVKSSALAGMSVIDNDCAVNRMLVDKSLTQRIGRSLYDLVFREAIRDLFNRCTSLVDEKNDVLRIRFQFQQTPELHVIPWELLHDGNRFLAIDPYRPIVRYLEQPRKERSMRIEPPLRVLFTTACPKGWPALTLEDEERCVRNALAAFGDKVQLTVERSVNSSRLRQAFKSANDRERPFHVWHHCGHGELIEEGDEKSYCLVLENEDDSEDLSDVSIVSTLIEELPSLRMVILNICSGACSGGLATALASLNTPCVVGFRTEVLDETALAFTKHFYENLPGVPVSVAMSMTRRDLFLRKSDRPWDWALPVLFMRSMDSILLPEGNNIVRKHLSKMITAMITAIIIGIIAFSIYDHRDDSIARVDGRTQFEVKEFPSGKEGRVRRNSIIVEKELKGTEHYLLTPPRDCSDNNITIKINGDGARHGSDLVLGAKIDGSEPAKFCEIPPGHLKERKNIEACFYDVDNGEFRFRATRSEGVRKGEQIRLILQHGLKINGKIVLSVWCSGS